MKFTTNIQSIGLREVYTIKEAARLTGLSERQLTHLESKGKISASGVGSFKFKKTDLTTFIEGLNEGKIEIVVKPHSKKEN